MELSLRILQSAHFERSIQRGRISVIFIDVLFFTSMVSACIYSLVGIETNDAQIQYFSNMGIFFACLFGVLFITLAISVIILIRLLWRKNKQVQQYDKNVFKREICTLVIILGVFCQSYAFRTIFDLIERLNLIHNGYKLFMTRLCLVVPFSLLPFFAMLMLHRRNLKASRLAVSNMNQEEN